MAAPTKTNRTRPSVTGTGLFMTEGLKSLVVFSANTALNFWEETVQFAMHDGGDPIPVTNMLNLAHETDFPRGLKKTTDLTMVGAYSGGSFQDMESMINVPQTITQIFPSTQGNWAAFYGWLKSATPQNNEPGKQPLIQLVIHKSNWDPTNNIEAGPAYGTGATLS